MDDLILQSKEIYDKAVIDYKPKAVVLMLSGGDDSMATYEVARELGIKFDFVIHGNTRTGIPDTTEFARKVVANHKDNYLEADAGDSYVKYVMRKGFFGLGPGAHNFSYNQLKNNHFKRVVSHNLRKGQRNFPVLFVNGTRRQESERRKKTMISPYLISKFFKNNIWVNLINEWDNHQCKEYLEGNGIERNPVSKNLCRSGECMCGTMQTQGDRAEAGYFYPEWKKWLDELEATVIALHGFGWGVGMPKKKKETIVESFQPMCVGCTKNVDE